MNLPEPQSVTFRSLFDQIRNGTVKIPQFQRSFVWTTAQSARLLDSVIKGYPIGTFILWSTKERLRSVRNLGGIELPDTPPGNAVKYVLDGQQRMTSLFVTLNGLTIQDEDAGRNDDYAQMWLDLEADDDAPLVLLDARERAPNSVIRLPELLHGDFAFLASYPSPAQERIRIYRNRIESYQYSVVQITDAPIDIATEIFTRLNVGGKPLTPFEIMVAKSYDPDLKFDLAERYQSLIESLKEIEYETLPESSILQTISILAKGDAKRKVILALTKDEVIDNWSKMEHGLKSAIDYFRSAYRIPASRLLPYPGLIIPFTYFFHELNGPSPTGNQARFLEDFFWRVSLSGRYSQSVESRSVQDIKRMRDILENKRPTYDWAIDVTPEFIEKNGYFSASRSFIKALLCLLARKRPVSFKSNVPVQLDNDCLKMANSKNYHHFFPKAWLDKKHYEPRKVNHIANITLITASDNKGISAKAPGTYIREFQSENDQLERALASHLIGKPESFGILDNDYDLFFRKRCRRLSSELHKRILPADADETMIATPAAETSDALSGEDNGSGPG